MLLKEGNLHNVVCRVFKNGKKYEKDSFCYVVSINAKVEISKHDRDFKSGAIRYTTCACRQLT
jgi:hypothetical protein